MEDKNVQKLLDMLYGMIDEARGATFSSEKCIINRRFFKKECAQKKSQQGSHHGNQRDAICQLELLAPHFG